MYEEAGLKTLLTLCGALLVATCTAAAASPVSVALAGSAAVPTIGKPWTAELTVRPRSFGGVVRVIAVGPGRLVVRASGGRGSYRARLVFPSAGRWKLTARAGGSTSRLGSVDVRKPPQLALVWPTSIDLLPNGWLLVVENGRRRVVRVHAATGRMSVIADGLAKPFAAVRAPSGSIYISDGRSLRRLDGRGKPVSVATAEEDIGPIAIAPNGDVFYATGSRLFRLAAGAGAPQTLATGLNGPHGLAVASDGAVLVSDTANGRVRRIDPQSGAGSTLVQTGEPRGIDVAPDGTIYVVEAGTKRIGHFSAAGARLGVAGPPFGDPYDVVAGAGGTVYVVDTAAAGRILRVAADGKVSSVPTG